MSSRARVMAALRNGEFVGKRIVLSDPDDLTGRTRNIYEDAEAENSARWAVVTLYPERAQALAEGRDAGIVLMTHAAAVADMLRMIDRFGYQVSEIGRDIWPHTLS